MMAGNSGRLGLSSYVTLPTNIIVVPHGCGGVVYASGAHASVRGVCCRAIMVWMHSGTI